MIEKLFLKNLISFNRVELEFEKGLVVLSGPSGAGKSLLMSSILSCFGLKSSEASLCELELIKPRDLVSQTHDLDDELCIRSLKKDKSRYYINDQNISKKSLRDMFAPYVNYLSALDRGGFESQMLLRIFDDSISSRDKSYKKMLKEYKKRYLNYIDQKAKLEKINKDERELAQLIEFANFEIDKIKAIDPKIGEDEELMIQKRQLSKIDKINEVLGKAELIFETESAVAELYELTDKDSGAFVESMNQLRSDFESAKELSVELEGLDVEALLDRLEKVSDLKNRYGSIEEAIAYKEMKELELAGYINIEQDKSAIMAFVELEHRELEIIAKRISSARVEESREIAVLMDEYLSRLKLPNVEFSFVDCALTDNGTDVVDMELNGSISSKLSGGEHNRLKLALLVASLLRGENRGGVIVLDEIDANVSGDESIAIAQMIAKLSSAYQIFAISHQPHLSAKADQHILVDKLDGVSSALSLDENGRVNEISRIISGEEYNQEAAAFAKKLLGERV